jgi:hypothetical protein
MKFFVILLACSQLLGTSTTRLVGDPLADDKVEVWVGDLPGVGKLALQLNPEYHGVRWGRLLWVFKELPVVWEPTKDGIALYHQVGFNQRGNTVALRLKLQTDKGLAFELGGLITPERLNLLKSCIFQKAPDSAFDDLASFLRANNQIEKFQSHGELNPLPESFPGPFMDVSVLLFSDDVQVLGPLLQYPYLSAEVLDAMGAKMLNPKSSADFLSRSHESFMPILAANSRISKDVLAQLFWEKTNPAIWRAAALNANAPGDYLSIYLTRVKEADTRTRALVARDRLAPKEAWEAALSKGEPEVLKELAGNPKVPQDILTQVEQQDPDAKPEMARNEGAPPEILRQLAQSQDKQILWALQRNRSLPPDSIRTVLQNLANHSSSSARGAAARDERTPVDLLEKLAEDPIIFVRGQIAMNTACPADLLEKLAVDPYSDVCERARENLKTRFSAEAIKFASSWTPLAQLNPSSNIQDELERYITDRNLNVSGA